MSKLDTGKYLDLFRTELYDNVLPFWLDHSLDSEHGGYFNCLDRDGRVYDTTKHMWLQCRQVWMLSRLYNALEKRDSWLAAARSGVDFIRKYGRSRDGRVYFSLSRKGSPVFIQRKIFAECFYIMALDEYSRAVGNLELKKEALEMFAKVLAWKDNPAALGRPVLSGQPEVSSLAVPMIILWVANQLAEGEKDAPFKELMEKSTAEMLLHPRHDKKIVLENVAPDGSLLEGGLGRLINPGHAIEAGWFLLERARKTGNHELGKAAISMIEWSFEKGWDPEHGGIFYFMDSEGAPPFQLEWFMKLWWPHCEALYALLLAWHATGDQRFANWFEQVADYAMSRFRDPVHGEWFGYLDREGTPTHTLKGGAYKGCFHVPRFLLLCIKLLEKIC